jgi:hypothetical protein
MGKSRKSSIVKSLKNTLPAVNSGLKTVGSVAKRAASASLPVIEKGVSAVYGTMASGLDLGVKGVQSVTKGVSRKHSRSRSRSLAGGRRTRHRRSRRHRRRH